MAAPVFPAAPVPLASRAVPATFSADNDAALVWEKAFRDVLAASIPFYEGTVTDSEQAVTDAEAQVALAVEQVALAVEQVGLAEDEVAEAVAQVELAGAQRVLAQAAAAAAIITANAPFWVSEASYTAGANAISPIDFGTYRAITTHTGVATDPSADATNWVLISAPAKATQVKAEAGTDNDDFMTSLRTAQAIAALSPSISTEATTGATQSIDFSSNKIVTSTANAAMVTYTFASPAAVAKVDLIIDYQALTSFDLDAASYDNISFSVATQETGPSALAFKPDGMKMYVVGAVNGTVYQYSLSTAWVVSSASYDNISFSVNSQETSPNAIFFKPDGIKMYVVGTSDDTVYQYSTTSAPTLVFPTLQGPTIPLSAGEKTAVTIVTADGGTSYQVISTLGGIV